MNGASTENHQRMSYVREPRANIFSLNREVTEKSLLSKALQANAKDGVII